MHGTFKKFVIQFQKPGKAFIFGARLLGQTVKEQCGQVRLKNSNRHMQHSYSSIYLLSSIPRSSHLAHFLKSWASPLNPLGWVVLSLLLAGTASGQSFSDQSAYFTAVPPGFSEAHLSWGDYDGDGDLDLLVMGQTGTANYSTKIYRNDGTGFVDSGTIDDALPQLRKGIAVWGDYNDNGRLGILIAGENSAGQPISEIYRRNAGSASPFLKDNTASSALSGSQVKNACADWGDYDNDGDLDLLLTGNTGSSVVAKLYKNNGGSTFAEDVIASANLIGVENGTVRWADMDNDGYLDIVMTGANSSGQPATRLFRNSGIGTFSNVVTLLPNYKNGSLDIGDYDADGDFDLLLTGEDLGGSTFYTKVFRNDGANVYTDLNATFANVTQGHAAWGDYNNDGDMDIVLTGKNGPASTNRTTLLYEYVGANFMIDGPSSAVLTAADQGAYVAWGDYDGDKKLDMMLAGMSASGRVLKLFRNINATPNTVPAAPPLLSLDATQVGDEMVLSWTKPTGGAGYTFNLFVINTLTSDTIKSPMSRLTTGYRRVVGPGNTHHKTSWRLLDLPAGTYTWGVQSVDADFEGSAFTLALLPFIYTPPTPGSLVFVDVTALEFAAPLPTGLTFSDISFGDHDGDGDLDFILSGQSGTTRSTKIYRHFKNGVTYTENTIAGGSITDDVSKGFSAWGDMDNDGDLDLLLSGQTVGNGRVSSVYRNNGNNTFFKLSFANAPIAAMSGSSGDWGDYDNDGDLDILISGNAASGADTKIYRNNGGSPITFTEDVAATSNVTGVEFGAVAWGDYNNDGYLDMVVTGNTPGGAIGKIYKNKQDGTFEDSGIAIANVKNGDVDWGDFNNDGDLDLVIVGESTTPVSALYRNLGNGTFNTVPTSFPGILNGSVEFGDYNNDGFLDLLMVGQNAVTSTSRTVKVYQNNQAGGFVEDIVASGNLTAMNEGASASWGDYDRDGKLDILMTGRNSGNSAVGSDVFKLYRNVDPTINTTPQAPTNLQTTLAGFDVNLTWDPPVGHPGGTVDGLNYSLYVSSAPNATVGDVVSPGSRITDGYRKVIHLGNANLNKSLTISNLDPGTYCWSVQAIDQDFEGSLYATEQCFAYDAPMFIDSTAAVFPLGVPAGLYDSDIAWGDFDSDGDLDILASGRTTTAGFSTAIYDNVNGDFVLDPASSALINVREGSVSWVDYDNDQDLDLLVSGLSASGRITQLYEHLGNNNTTNYFAAPGVSLAALSKSAAAWGDYDNDGFVDLLITGENNSGAPQTLLYKNNDGTSFSLIATGITNVKNAGVAWADYDKDGDLDLLISGETTGSGAFSGIYRNDGANTFTLITSGLPALKSSAVAWGDYNNDGDLDILIAGQTAAGAAVTKVFQNNNNGTFTDILAPLTGAYSGSVAWGDYNNDGYQDILLTGKDGSGTEDRITKLYEYLPLTNAFSEDITAQAPLTSIDAGAAVFGDYDNDHKLDILLVGRSTTTPAAGVFRVYHNNDATAGVGIPPAPVNPTATLSGFEMLLSWDPPVGYPAARVDGLSYNVYIGATSTNPNQLSPLSLLATGRRKVVQMGNTGQNQLNFPVTGLTGGTYSWGVQAVDADYEGSLFVNGGTFTYSPPTFIDVTGQMISPLPLGLSEADLDWGDYDNDGDLDLLISGEVNASTYKTTIYRNDGATFSEISSGLPGLAEGSVSWGDYDNDGWLDVLLSGEQGTAPFTKVYRNIMGTSFTDINAPITPVKDGEAIWGDVNNDGYLDVLVTGQGTVATGAVGAIFTYDPVAGFVNSGIVLPKLIFSAAAWGDYNNDSYPDLILAGQNPSNGTPQTRLYRNDANGNLVNTGIAFPGLRYPSLEWGDYDNDGYLDLLMTGEVTSPVVGEQSRVYRNTGIGSFTFTEVSTAAAPLANVKQGDARWADYDNDGDLDIVLVGQAGLTRVAEAYTNTGAGAFTAAPVVALPLSDVDDGSNLAFGDFNNDGKIDLALAGRSLAAPATNVLRIYENVDTTTNQSPGVPTALQAVISGDTVILNWNPPANAAGYSYNLYVGTSAGAIDQLAPMSSLSNGYRKVVRLGRGHTATSFQLRDLDGGTYFWSVQAVDQDFEGSAFAAQQSFTYVPPILLNTTPLVISPAPDGLNNGQLVWVDADLDGDLDLMVTGEKGTNDYVARIYRNNGGALTLVFDTLGVRWPAIAWADYDQDGDADLLLSGQNNAGNRTTVLLKNSGGNRLVATATPFPAVYGSAADWGDYDNDGDLDLVISGNSGTNTFTTQLFRNDSGSFVEDEYVSGQLPDVQFGSLKWGDYDGDGYLDLLMTGETATGLVSKVFRNLGDRSFQDINAPMPGVREGTAEWGDFNNDGYLDILLTGESSAAGFSPVANLYRYNPGSGNFTPFAAGTLTPVKRGMAAWGDYDDDGWLDILLTGQDGPSSADRTTQFYRNQAGIGFLEDAGTSLGLENADLGSYVAWGDYDGDKKLDLALLGRTSAAPTNQRTLSVYRNVDESPNLVAAAPGTLAAVVDADSITFQWQAPAGYAAALANGLSYNLYLSSAPAPAIPDYISPLAGLATGYRRVVRLGPISGTSWTIRDLPTGTWYWSVQAIEADFEGSPFAPEQTLAYQAPIFIDETNFVTRSGSGEGLDQSSLAWGDYDNDNDLDLLLSGQQASHAFRTALWENVDGELKENTAATAALTDIRQGSVAWGDMNEDDELDIAISGESVSGPVTAVFIQQNGVFTNINAALTGLRNSSLAWADYDRDGDLDLLVTGETNASQPQTILYNNDGNGGFANSGVSMTAVSEGSVAWSDLDNDGWLDVLITGKDVGGLPFVQLYKNATDGTFDPLPSTLPGLLQSSVAWGDYDNDGYPDLLISGESASGPVTQLFHNEGDETFTNSGFNFVGIRSGRVSWGDYDDNGYLDVLLVGQNGANLSDRIALIYHNNSGASFTVDVTASQPLADANTLSDAAWGDYTGDNKLDIAIAGRINDAPLERVLGFYRNNQQTPNQQLSAPDTLANDASGADVILTWAPPAGVDPTQVKGLTYNVCVGTVPGARDVINPHADTTGYRKIVAAGNAAHARAIRVTGLSDGIYYWSVQAIGPDYEGSPFATEASFRFNQKAFKDVTPTAFPFGLPTAVSEAAIAFGDFDDNGFLDIVAAGSLSSTANSTTIYSNSAGIFQENTIAAANMAELSKSAVDVGDYDNDGFVDIVLTGLDPAGNPTTHLYHNEGDSTFDLDIAASALLQAVSAGSVAWGDYNNDGKADLLLTGQAVSGPFAMLYRNEGNGIFTEAPEAFAAGALKPVSHSSVAWADYDADGDLDFIMTGKAASGPFTGVYRNNADGTFSEIPTPMLDVMDGSVAWGDFENDGDLDVVVSGENSSSLFVPVTKLYIYNATNGTFGDPAVPISLLQVKNSSVSWGDYNKDGYSDLLLSGRFGEADTAVTTRIYQNESGIGFSEDINTSSVLDDIDLGQSMFGDFDNANGLDIVLTGQTSTLPPVRTFGAYLNIDSTLNITPPSPRNLGSEVIGDKVRLFWEAPTALPGDRIAGLTYNIVVGSDPGLIDQFSPLSRLGDGYRRVVKMGAGNQSLEWTITGLQPGIYFWSVQTIDQDFEGSPFAPETSFNFINPAPVIIDSSYARVYVDTTAKAISTIEVEDTSVVDRVIVHYKGIAGSDWSAVRLTDEGPVYTFDITPAQIDEIGVEYYFEAVGKFGFSAVTDTTYTYIRYTGNGLTVPALTFGPRVTDYNIIAIPLDLDNKAISSTIEDDLGTYDIFKWRFYHYQGGSNQEYKSGISQIDAGKGYWLIAKDRDTVMTGAGETVKVHDRNPFALSLSQGWNQVGNPYNFKISWTEVLAANSVAVQGAFIEPFRTFQGGWDTIGTPIIDEFRGGFVFAERAVEIEILVRKNPAIQRFAPVGGGLSLENPIDDAEWEVKIRLESGGLVNPFGAIGMRPDADSSRDRYDRISLPRLHQYLDMHVAHPEFFSPRFMKDIIPTAKQAVWEFRVESNLGEEAIRMSWDNDFFGQGQRQLILFDVENQRQINMGERSSYTSISDQSSRLFRVYYGTEEWIGTTLQPDHVHLAHAYPNPFQDETRIAFTLPPADAPYSLLLEVVDQAGKQVRTLAQGEFEGGFYEWVWDGNTDLGQSVASGIYLYQLRVVQGGQQKLFSRKVIRN